MKMKMRKKMRVFIQKDTDSEAKKPGTLSMKSFNLLIRQNTVVVKDCNY